MKRPKPDPVEADWGVQRRAVTFFFRPTGRQRRANARRLTRLALKQSKSRG